jgi:hypothetical protein
VKFKINYVDLFFLSGYKRQQSQLKAVRIGRRPEAGGWRPGG